MFTTSIFRFFIQENAPELISRDISFFHPQAGEPLKGYVLQTKIQHVQLLLTTNAMPVSDIAAMFSFSSSSHFTKVFEYFTKETPTAYRTQHSHLV
ncbi:helix-turn-helix domain-containing protein [Eisenbergiella porci]|uniref:helix-turn-helix domain-containing protein n=1 Tax=Eisenbergiella porci TaxID=2652274 RepID=UPI003FA459C0